jgi:hypothetical protein
MAIKMGVLNKKLLWQYYSPIPNIILMYKQEGLSPNNKVTGISQRLCLFYGKSGLATLILK